MTDVFKQYQNVITVVVVLIVGFIAYTMFFTDKEEGVLIEETVSENSAADQDLIALLSELKSIELDEAVFSDPTFMSLQDFSQELVPEPVGRVNPFAPLGDAPFIEGGQ
jgi:hypothetical protein